MCTLTGLSLMEPGQLAEAANEFQLEFRTIPAYKARIYLADSWLRQTESEKALSELEGLDAGDQSEPLLHFDLGIIYANIGRSEDAIRELRRQ